MRSNLVLRKIRVNATVSESLERNGGVPAPLVILAEVHGQDEIDRTVVNLVRDSKLDSGGIGEFTLEAITETPIGLAVEREHLEVPHLHGCVTHDANCTSTCLTFRWDPHGSPAFCALAVT